MKTKLKILIPLLALTLACLAPISKSQAKGVEGVVNVNTATAQQLTLLPGVGKVKAEAIIQARQSKPFKSLEDLKALKGLGTKRLEAMKGHVVFSGETTAKRVRAAKTNSKDAKSDNPQS